MSDEVPNSSFKKFVTCLLITFVNVMRGLVYVTVGPPPSSIVFINCLKKLVNPFRMIMIGSPCPVIVKVND